MCDDAGVWSRREEEAVVWATGVGDRGCSCALPLFQTCVRCEVASYLASLGQHVQHCNIGQSEAYPDHQSKLGRCPERGGRELITYEVMPFTGFFHLAFIVLRHLAITSLQAHSRCPQSHINRQSLTNKRQEANHEASRGCHEDRGQEGSLRDLQAEKEGS